jgi:hypothetical protein
MNIVDCMMVKVYESSLTVLFESVVDWYAAAVDAKMQLETGEMDN